MNFFLNNFSRDGIRLAYEDGFDQTGAGVAGRERDKD